MYDNELADQAQHILDALDEFLDNGEILRQLSADDLATLRKHRAGLSEKLDVYRIVHFMGKRRRLRQVTAPSGPQQGSTMSVVLAARLAAAGAGAAAGASTVAVGTGAGTGSVLLGTVILPIIAIFAGVIALDAVTGGSPHAKATRMLRDAVEALGKDLLKLDQALSSALAAVGIAAGVVTVLDVVEALVKAAQAGEAMTVSKLLAELAALIPAACLALGKAVQAATNKVHNLKKNPSLAGYNFEHQLKMITKAKEAVNDALSALVECINAAGLLEPADSNP